MFTVIQIGSSQFKVSEGDTITTNRLKDKQGKSVTLDKVLMYAKGTDVRVGQPYLKDVKVTAKVLNHDRGRKVLALKYRRRKDSASLIGHRQDLSTLKIDKITA